MASPDTGEPWVALSGSLETAQRLGQQLVANQIDSFVVEDIAPDGVADKNYSPLEHQFLETRVDAVVLTGGETEDELPSAAMKAIAGLAAAHAVPIYSLIPLQRTDLELTDTAELILTKENKVIRMLKKRLGE